MAKNDEQDFLEHYDPNVFDRASLTVDIVIFTVFDEELRILLVQRADFPAKNQWALPGGFIDIKQDETLEQCAQRKLIEKTGVEAPYLEQLKSYGSASRDPRGWTATVVYFALLSADSVILSGNQKDARWISVTGNKVSTKLAFDHADIVMDAVERLRAKLEYSHIAVHLLPETFTQPELQKTYEIILQEKLDKSSFRRRIAESGMLEEVTGKKQDVAGRPAQLYRFKQYDRRTFFPRSLIRYAK